MRKAIISIIFLLSLITGTLGISACFSNEKIQLYAPENLHIEGRILTWDEVENASGYKVSVAGEEKETQENSFVLLNLTGPATYNIMVAALGDDIRYTNSPYNDIEFTLEAPIAQAYDSVGFKYTLLEDGTGYEIHHGKLSDSDEVLHGTVYLPDFFNNYPVKRIADSAFTDYVPGREGNVPDPFTEAYCLTTAKGFRLPAYLESIGDCAFYGCVRVEEFVLPESVTEIGSMAFKSCKRLKRINIPDGVKEINCFEYCSLEEITLPEGLEIIGNRAFMGGERVAGDKKFRIYNSFKSIVIPESVTEIGDLAFGQCFDLTDISLPRNLQYMGDKVFGYTAWYEAQADGFVTIRGDILHNYKGDKVGPEGLVQIPSHIKYIAAGSFYKMNNIVEIIIPDGVKFIGDSVFSDCDSLTKVRLPSDLEVIPEKTFGGCSSLKEIVIPDSVTKIDFQAFVGSAIESIKLSDSLTEIGQAAFSECHNLKQIELPDSVTEIGSMAFARTAIESIVIPASVKKLGHSAIHFTTNIIPVKGKPLKELFYKGTQEQWEEIEKEKNETIDKATKYFYSETRPSQPGNFWHYVDGKVTVW